MEKALQKLQRAFVVKAALRDAAGDTASRDKYLGKSFECGKLLANRTWREQQSAALPVINHIELNRVEQL